MALVAREDKLLIAFNRKIVVIDLLNQNVTNTVVLDPDITPKVDVYPKSYELGETLNPPPVADRIEEIGNLAISPNGEFLAVTTTGRKLLLLYNIRHKNLHFLSARRICRASSAIIFSNDSNKVLVCDKTGDCYVFDCLESEVPGKWIFGHLSMILDVRFAGHQDAVLTSDRDEKIRVTSYPKTHEIKCYCLGHTEYVSSMSLLPTDANEFMISVSGDKTIRVWNYGSGEQVHLISIPAPGVKLVVRQVENAVSHLAVTVYQPDESVFMYKLEKVDGDRFESSLISSHSFPDQNVIDMKFHGSTLYLTTSKDGCLQLQSIKYETGTYHVGDTSDLNSDLAPVLEGEVISGLDDASEWFKKKYDNVSDYLRRKKLRIDEKLGKLNSIRCN